MRIIGQTQRIRRKQRQLGNDLRRMGRRQEADSLRDEAGGKAHGKAVSIGAHVQHVPRLGQTPRQVVSIG
jgi:hypothetical protein